MAFQYYGADPQYGQQQQNPYSTAQPQQQGQGGGMDTMMQGLGAFQQMGGMDMFGGGAGGATAGGGTAMAGGPGAGSAAAAGSGGAAGGGGMGSGLAAAGPWAALAAVIIGNESASKDAGRRDDDDSSYAVDLMSGAVLEQDMDYYGDKVGGVGGEILQGIGKLGNPEGTLNLIKDIF